MALDAIVEAAGRVIGGFLLEVVFIGIFYWPGWLILRLVTFGRYPPKRLQAHSRAFVAALGFSAILSGVLLNMPGGGLQ